MGAARQHNVLHSDQNKLYVIFWAKDVGEFSLIFAYHWRLSYIKWNTQFKG